MSLAKRSNGAKLHSSWISGNFKPYLLLLLARRHMLVLPLCFTLAAFARASALLHCLMLLACYQATPKRQHDVRLAVTLTQLQGTTAIGRASCMPCAPLSCAFSLWYTVFRLYSSSFPTLRLPQ